MQGLPNTSPETLLRGLTRQGFYKGAPGGINTFDAVADYEKSFSSGLAGFFALFSLGFSIGAYKLFHYFHKADKHAGHAFVLSELLINQGNLNKVTIGTHIIEDIDGVARLDGNIVQQGKSLNDIRKQLVHDVLAFSNPANNEQIRWLKQKIALKQVQSTLSEQASAVFLPLFNIQETGLITSQSPIVSGDLDGSTARQVVLGIQSGIISIDEEGVKDLVMIMETEGLLISKLNQATPSPQFSDNELKRFQQNAEIQGALSKLVTHLTYHPGHTPLLFIGDVAHDRFSCNKNADCEIRKKMSENGAIFIRGNHDVLFSQTKKTDTQFGDFALDSLSAEEWVEHQRLVFRNVYYDVPARTLYLHHGIKIDTKNGDITTAFGHYPYADGSTFDPADFEEKVNAMLFPDPLEIFEKKLSDAITRKEKEEKDRKRLEANNRNWHDELTSFRPTEKGVDDMNKLAAELGIRIVYGHDGLMDLDQSHILGINSRTGNSRLENKLAVVAVRIGEARKVIN